MKKSVFMSSFLFLSLSFGAYSQKEENKAGYIKVEVGREMEDLRRKIADGVYLYMGTLPDKENASYVRAISFDDSLIKLISNNSAIVNYKGALLSGPVFNEDIISGILKEYKERLLREESDLDANISGLRNKLSRDKEYLSKKEKLRLENSIKNLKARLEELKKENGKKIKEFSDKLKKMNKSGVCMLVRNYERIN